MDYPTFYASSKAGWLTTDVEVAKSISRNEVSKQQYGMEELLDAILDYLPPPVLTQIDSASSNSPALPFALTTTMVGYDKFLGRTATGKVHQGSAIMGDNVTVISRASTSTSTSTSTNNTNTEEHKPSNISGIFVYKGVTRTALESNVAMAGDIVTITGVPDTIQVGGKRARAKREAWI